MAQSESGKMNGYQLTCINTLLAGSHQRTVLNCDTALLN